MRIYASLEPKALETAALVASRLGLDVGPRGGLEENDRTGLGFVAAEKLNKRMRRFFEEPSRPVIGEETAQAALARFEAALAPLAAEANAGSGSVAVVTHGTVLTLLVAKYNPVIPFNFWESLALPSCVRLDCASFKLAGPVRNWRADLYLPPRASQVADSSPTTSTRLPMVRLASTRCRPQSLCTWPPSTTSPTMSLTRLAPAVGWTVTAR